MTSKEKGAIYARLSKEDQGERVGIDAQIAICEDYAELHGIVIVETFIDDGIGGAVANRPGMTDAIRAAKAGTYEHLITRSHRRFARNQKVANRFRTQLYGQGVSIHYVLTGGLIDPDTEAGLWQDGIMDLAAEAERLRITRRVTEGRRNQAKAGTLQLSRRPFGYSLAFASAAGSQGDHP